MKEKINLHEELNRMKNLFGYEKGVVISEQDFKPFDPKGNYPSLGIGGNQSNLTPKQKEAMNAGWGPLTDEAAKRLAVDTNGKIIPKKVSTPSDAFAAFPCVKNLKTEKKATGTNIQGPTKTGVEIKIGEGSLKQYMFGSDGTLYSYGQEYGKWSCGTKPNTININGKEVSNTTTTTTKTLPGVTVVTIPKELKDKEGVKKFQDWMDTNHPNWVKGKNLNKGGGYGNFGPSTRTAWNKYKNEYLLSQKIKFTRPSVTDADKPVDDSQVSDYAAKSPTTGGLGVPTDDGELYADNY
jgi:hypothetical protein